MTEIKEVQVYVDQNIPVFADNRYLTLRLGIGLRADVTEPNLTDAARELHAKAEALLNQAVDDARLSAQRRLQSAADEQARRIAQEKDVM